MNLKFFKFNKINFGLKGILSSPPQRYWSYFLALLLLLFLIVLIFNGWVFWRFSLRGASEDLVGSAPRSNILDQDSLNRTLERIQTKEKNFARFEINFSLEGLE